MHASRPFASAVATLALAAALPATATARIEPSRPTAFERVELRLTVDSCAFNASTVRVRAAGNNTLQVTQQPNACLLPGEPREVDILLGALAAGDYRVEVYDSPHTDAPARTLAFSVFAPVEAAVFPPPPRPLTQYTGLWWNPAESGWGLSLHQGPLYTLFGAWFVYGATSEPQWFTLQGGQWEDATTWRGTVYRTTGPFFAGPAYDPRLVLVQAVGTATLDFRHLPGALGKARFTVSMGGTTTTRVIEPMRF